MNINTTATTRKILIQKSTFESLISAKTGRIPTELLVKIADCRKFFAQITAKTTNVNHNGEQMYGFTGNPRTERFVSSDLSVKPMIGLSQVIPYFDKVIKELGEIE